MYFVFDVWQGEESGQGGCVVESRKVFFADLFRMLEPSEQSDSDHSLDEAV